jgi:predicted metal-dependent HD superfamily phosphohydrolase
MDSARWRQLMGQWGADGNDDVYSRLLSAYSEPHRQYHTVQHIDDCLAQFDEAASLANALEEVEVALWFHDAVYQPTSSSNELKSAEWAASFLRSIGVAADRCHRVHRYILATKHGEDPLSGDAALVVDIDLSILGRDSRDFEVYERAIRKEYKWVPGPIYRRKRAEILRSFLDRPAIFATDRFREQYESQARENLEWAIQRLRR